jgi:hypothetical protein
MKSDRVGWSRGDRQRRFETISAHELGRPKARLGNPNTGIPEVVVQPIYDIYFVAAGSAMGLLTLFSVQQGQSYSSFGVTAFTKGQGHTNLVQAGMLQSSYTFIVRALSISVMGLQSNQNSLLHPADLNNFLYSYMEFDINSKPYFQGLGAWLPCGGGGFMGGVGTLTAPAASVMATNGWPDVDNMYALPGGQYINPQETFSFIINPSLNAGGSPTAANTTTTTGTPLPLGVTGNGLSAWVRLDGTLIRVAQ